MRHPTVPPIPALSAGWLLAASLFASLSGATSLTAAAIPEPSALREIGKAVLEEKSAAQQKLLGDFAKHYRDQVPGVLAHLTLGYAALENRDFAAASRHFEAASQRPTLVQDYAVYYQAVSEAARNNHQTVTRLLEEFAARYPASPLASRAVLLAGRSLLSLGRSREAIALLQAATVPLPEPEGGFLLAQAYQQDKQWREAVAAYRRVFYHYPATDQAAEAEEMLSALRARMGGDYPPATAEMWQVRADKLYGLGRWRDALSAYRTLASLAGGTTLDHARVREGACLYHLQSTWPALTTLQKLSPAGAEAGAERLYLLAAAYRRLGRREQMEEQIALLGRRYPQSSWHARALLLGGNYYLLEKDYDRAGSYYRKSYQEFPEGEEATIGHWKVAWQAYRERRWADAKHLFAEHIQTFSTSPQVPAALYWLGRLTERESPAAAARYYHKIAEAFPNYYYGLLARRRLADLPAAPAAAVAVMPVSLDHIQRRGPASRPATAPPQNEGLYRERMRLLESAWLIDWAIEEMRAVVARDAAATWAGQEMARLERERGRYHVALRYAKRYVPSYFAQRLPELSREVWELLFPRPYWQQLQQQAASAKVDPFLVAGLIRQESEFDPRARSRSNARGLMQLLPSTARLMARRVPDPRARRYSLASLYLPDINLVYGTFYLKKVLDQFDGIVEYALAGYNAGENRVVEWLRQGPFEEPAEFVESIPFTETREYVQAVLRNAALYRELYAGNN